MIIDPLFGRSSTAQSAAEKETIRQGCRGNLAELKREN
jgi:hypothetical protein